MINRFALSFLCIELDRTRNVRGHRTLYTTEADVEGEKALREWAAAQKVTSKTVDLLIKDGFNSMEAVDLLDCDDLLQSNIPRGQQKLLLKALQKGPYSPNTSATAHGSGSEAGPSGEGSGG